MFKSTSDRTSVSINAGSMADIAFLLLIFFLVTTTILEDKGILVRLPPYEKDVVIPPIPAKNILAVNINTDNQLMIEGEMANVEDIREITKEFILNPNQLSTLPSKPKNAVISLQHDRGTEYKTYLEVYNELKAAYREIWEERAFKNYGKAYGALSVAEQKAIRKDIPLVISEAEPSEW